MNDDQLPTSLKITSSSSSWDQWDEDESVGIKQESNSAPSAVEVKVMPNRYREKEKENGIPVVAGKGKAPTVGIHVLQGRKELSEEERRRLHIGSPGAVTADENFVTEDWD